MSLDYLAGLIDGEGYIGIRRCTAKHDGSLIPEFKPTLVITNTSFNLMEELKANFSGSINHKKIPLDKSHWKPSYTFEFNRSAVREILPQLVDRLLIKRDQAMLVLSLFETYKHTFPGNGYNAEELAMKEEIHKACLVLNKRGITL